MRRLVLLPLVTATLAMAAAGIPLAGQSIPSPYRFIEERQELGIFAGTFWGDPGRYDLGPGTGVVGGVRYGIDLSGPLSIEGVGSVASATRDVINPRRDEGDRKVEEAEAALLFLEARLRFSLTGRRTWYGFQPFLFAGGGVAFDIQGNQAEDELLASVDRFDFGTQFLGTTGAGARYLLGRRWVIRADATLYLYQVDTPGGFLDPDRNLDLGTVPESEWVSSTSVTLGFAFRF
jgi:hypothetical protein